MLPSTAGAERVRFQFAGAALFQILLDALEAFFHLGEIADHQVEFDVLHVAQRIDGSDVWNGIVFEGAQNMNQRIDVTQAGEERGFLQRLLPDRSNVDVLDEA